MSTKKERKIQTPVVKKTESHHAQQEKISLKHGQVLMVQVDKDGEEIAGTAHITSLATFKKSYEHLNFKIKKKK